MEYLIPNFWNLFKNREGRFIGKEFEKLIQDVLKLRLGCNWNKPSVMEWKKR